LLPRGAPLVGHLLHAGARAWALARELVQARLELRHAGPRSCQLVHYQRDLPAREPEAEQGRRQPLVQPRETRGAARERGAAEPARGGTQYGFALGDQTAEAGELREEASALTVVLLARLGVLLALVLQQIAETDVSGAKPLAEAEHATQAERRHER